MKAYIKKHDARSVIASIDVRENEIQFKVNGNFGPQEEIQNVTLPISEILKDTVTKATLKTPHNVLMVGMINNILPKHYKVLNVLRENQDVKNGPSSLERKYDLKAYFLIFIPFADSPVSDWTFVGSAETLTLNGQPITEEIDVNADRSIAITCNELLSTLTLSNNNGIISAQISPVKENIEIYWETTTGSLTHFRSYTNAQGIATTNLIDVSNGKIKAGFKYFSGKAELQIA